MCNRTHWSLSPFMLQADGFCSLMKKDHDLAHAGRFIRFNIAIGKASISTSKNKKGYKTRSTRNDIAHVNEKSITDLSSSINVITLGSGPRASVICDDIPKIKYKSELPLWIYFHGPRD